MTEIASADGAWLVTPDGRRILDCISSWWVVTHGHGHPAIIEAAKRQCDQLDQVIFAGFTHKPAEEVAAGLLEFTPDALTRVFFSDSGSTAVEVALKMALGYWRNTGGNRTRILALEHAYHGDTVGTMSTGARGVFNAAYEPLLFEVNHLPFPEAGREQTTLDALEAECKKDPPAALIVEPLILGAGGMLTYPAWVVTELKRICDRYDVLFILDEVMTGWGRTGTMFAFEQTGIVPDIICLAKGLTGGSLPLAVTLCREDIYAAHYDEDRTRTLFHSSSFTANPICCAAASANLKLWRDEPVLDRISALASAQADCLNGLREDKRFSNIRQQGTIAAFDLRVTDAGYLANVGPKLHIRLLELGFLIRPLGNTIYLMPPYCVTPDELKSASDAIRSAVGEVVGS